MPKVAIGAGWKIVLACREQVYGEYSISNYKITHA